METCDGVPAAAGAAGVPGLDEDALSPLAATATGSAGRVIEGAGDSLTGDSSLGGIGSRRFRSLSGDTLSVTNDVLPADFRRSFSFVVVVFVVAGILAGLVCEGTMLGGIGWEK